MASSIRSSRLLPLKAHAKKTTNKIRTTKPKISILSPFLVRLVPISPTTQNLIAVIGHSQPFARNSFLSLSPVTDCNNSFRAGLNSG